MKKLLISLWLVQMAWAQAPVIPRLEGKVWAVESGGVYVTDSGGNAVRAPLNATFLRAGQPVPVSDLKVKEPITVIYPVDDFEVLAGPYPPNDANPNFHRTIRRGPDSLNQDYLEGAWVDR